MKSTRALIMIFFSLIAGGVAVWLAARWVGQQASENSTAVVVANKDLDPGALLTPDMLTQTAWPNGSLPAGAFTDLKKLETRVVAGSVIYKGEALLEAKLAPEGSSGGLSSVIPTGMRAISIHANEIVGVAGYIRPGSLVDIMVNTKDKNEKPISKIVLEKILVLATAQDDKRDQNKPKVVSAVTLQVEPGQAEKIDLARSIGTLSLVLRNPLDKGDVATGGANRDDLMAGEAAAKPAAPATAPVKTATARSSAPKPKVVSAPVVEKAELVEVIRGVQKANSNF
jgi:pilus assembly protein CpaB